VSPDCSFLLNTQDTGRRETKQINVRENQRAIKNEQSGDTDNTEHTIHRTKTNKTKTKLRKDEQNKYPSL
jgi:hypothetical protein